MYKAHMHTLPKYTLSICRNSEGVQTYMHVNLSHIQFGHAHALTQTHTCKHTHPFFLSDRTPDVFLQTGDSTHLVGVLWHTAHVNHTFIHNRADQHSHMINVLISLCCFALVTPPGRGKEKRYKVTNNMIKCVKQWVTKMKGTEIEN